MVQLRLQAVCWLGDLCFGFGKRLCFKSWLGWSGLDGWCGCHGCGLHSLQGVGMGRGLV